MRRFFSSALAACICTSFLSSGAHAEGMTLGEFEYKNSCAACHGPSGDGDGPLAEYLVTGSLPQLSMLQKNNGGVFPVSDVYAVIEGTADVRAHGFRDMPVWGDRYRARIDPAEDVEFDAEDIDAYVTFRILALIEYLSTLQVE